MYMSGPSNARVNQSVTVTASGAPQGTTQIKFEASGNVGFDTVDTSSGSASFRITLDFAGTTTISATAMDAFMNVLGRASHSIAVTDPDLQARGRGGYGGWFMGPTEARVGETIHLSASGLDNAVRAEFGASGFDLSTTSARVSGGSTSVSARAVTAGNGSISVRAYDENGVLAHEATHTVQVTRATDMKAQPLRVFVARNCEAGRPWTVKLTGVSRYPSLTVEFFGSVGGIFRYFPRGRDEMRIHFQHPNPGEAHMFVMARDERCQSVQSCRGKFMIAPQSSHGYAGTPFRDDDEGDDWQSKMDEIDQRFSWKGDDVDGYDRRRGERRNFRGDDVDGYNRHRGDDVDGYDRRQGDRRRHRGDDVDGYNRHRGDDVDGYNRHRGDDVDGYDRSRRGKFKGDDVDGYNRHRGDDVDGYDRHRGDDVDGYNLRQLVVLPATGKPPVSMTWNPNTAGNAPAVAPSAMPMTAPMTAPAPPPTSTAAPNDLSSLLNSKTQEMLNRLNKR